MSNTKKVDKAETTLSPLEAAQAEALAGNDPINVKLVTKFGEAVVTVLAPMDWQYDAVSFLKVGDIANWLSRVMSEQDFAAVDSLHPTNREVLEFAQEWQTTSGQDLGKSAASQ